MQVVSRASMVASTSRLFQTALRRYGTSREPHHAARHRDCEDLALAIDVSPAHHHPHHTSLLLSCVSCSSLHTAP